MAKAICTDELSAVAAHRGPGLLLVAQAAIALLLLAGLALVPPRTGPMMVIPFSGTPVKPWLDAQDGVVILGLGTIAGSMIVRADRNNLLSIAAAHHAVLLPALPMLCSQNPIRQEVEVGRPVA